MKYWTFIIFSFLLLSFSGCKKEKTADNENYIAVNQCKTFTREEKSITCCLDSIIEDSRCPINAVCIWEGRGVARFKVSTQNTIHTIALATNKFTPYRKDTTLAGFNIELMNLFPQSEVNRRLNYKEYVAEVKITKF
jgi:hypothetical protein